MRTLTILAVGLGLGLALNQLGGFEAHRPAAQSTGAIRVVDGDTVAIGSTRYRLIGFDTPETMPEHAKCPAEIERGHAAKLELERIVRTSRVQLVRQPCSCPPGIADGDKRCDYGRLCADLYADGRNVRDMLERAGLAKPYPYRYGAHVPKPDWCSP